ncbi:MAG: TraB/GumN family protein [Rickettsiales bacterium]|nr:TraB/GumN family protein [Rickettsiales bacterium]
MAASPYPKALLYRAEHKDYQTAYVFGTFHSDSPALKPMFVQAAGALNKVDTLLLEINATPASQRKALQLLTLSPEVAGLHELLSKELFRRAERLIRPVLDISLNEFDRYKPWALAVLAQYPKPEANGVVLDEKIRIAARKLQKQIKGLESVEQQMSIFNEMSMEDQIAFLTITLDQMNTMSSMNDEIKTLYLDEDIDGMLALSERVFADMAKTKPKLAKYLKARVIGKRNKHMLNEALKEMKNAKALIAVGALHLPGDNGVLALLEDKGFKVTPLPILKEPAAALENADPFSSDKPATGAPPVLER